MLDNTNEDTYTIVNEFDATPENYPLPLVLGINIGGFTPC